VKPPVALAIALLVGCAAKAPLPVHPTLAPLQVRCAHAGNSGVRLWVCSTKEERAEFAGALFYPLPNLPNWPVHFSIVRDHHPQWAEVIERKTKLRGTIRFEDGDVQTAGGDLGVHTFPLVNKGRAIAYLTWCMTGEFDTYKGPLASPAAAMSACRAFWKKTLGSGEGGNSVSP
jgi:hypothetical protein